MPKNTNRGYPLAVAVAAALLAAVSIVCGKYLAIRGGDILRFSFENLPLILAGMAFGPTVATLTGIAADLIGCLLVGYAINPVVTLGAALIGLVSGICFRRTEKLSLAWRIGITTAAAHLIGSVVVKTVGLSAFYDMPLLQLAAWRLLNYAIVGGVEGILLYAIFKSQAVKTELERISGRRI